MCLDLASSRINLPTCEAKDSLHAGSDGIAPPHGDLRGLDIKHWALNSEGKVYPNSGPIVPFQVTRLQLHLGRDHGVGLSNSGLSEAPHGSLDTKMREESVP